MFRFYLGTFAGLALPPKGASDKALALLRHVNFLIRRHPRTNAVLTTWNKYQVG